MHTTTRLALDVADATDNVSAYPAVDSQAKGILDNAALVTEGTLPNRPAAGTVEHNRVYHATDTSTWYVSDGANWTLIGTPLSGTAASRPAVGVFGRTYYATDTGVWSVDNGTAWQDLLATRGAVNIAASESRTNTAYGTLTTPDQVTGIVLPTNGLIRVWYQATWQESVSGQGRAAIFVGATQQQTAVVSSGTPSPLSQAAMLGGTANRNAPLTTAAFGLVSVEGTAGYAGDATNGQATGLIDLGNALQVDLAGAGGQAIFGANPNVAVGGPCDIFATAGTYAVGVQFKAASGSVTASNRKLWVKAEAFV